MEGRKSREYGEVLTVMDFGGKEMVNVFPFV